MFKDTKEGQTHYEGDNCGELAHNSPAITDKEKLSNEELKEQGIDLEKGTYNLDKMFGLPGFHNILSEIEYDLHRGSLQKKLADYIHSLLSHSLQGKIERIKAIDNNGHLHLIVAYGQGGSNGGGAGIGSVDKFSAFKNRVIKILESN